MSYDKSPSEERRFVVHRREKRPYGAEITLRTRTSGALGLREGVGISFANGAIATVDPGRKTTWEGGERYRARLEGYRSAGDAEAAGKQFVLAVLWAAVSFDEPVQLEYQTQQQARVLDRTKSEGATLTATGEVIKAFAPIAEEIDEVFVSGALRVPDRLLLSLEIFCAAPLESSNRARFISTVSALEPIAAQQPLGGAVDDFVAGCITSLASTEGIDAGMRASLRGRLEHLRRESVRQALLRLLREHFPTEPQVVKDLDGAYALRSELLHEGAIDPDIDLPTETTKVAAAMRNLYARMLGRPLARPA